MDILWLGWVLKIIYEKDFTVNANFCILQDTRGNFF